MNKNILKYISKKHELEINPNTKWHEYGILTQSLDYRWNENETWYDDDNKLHKGKWVSYNISMIDIPIFTLLANQEETKDLLFFANKVMGVNI
jgi:hypothetical protein